MTFTYVSTLADDISLIRFHIGDTVENNGPRPNAGNVPSATNYQDEELAAILTSVGDDVNKAVASLLGTLATEWQKLAISVQVGPYKEDLYRIADGYRKRADDWKKEVGLAGYAFSSGVIRRSNANSGSVT